MFIGGGPAGTAGGIKVTTIRILGSMVLAEIRSDASVHVHHRRIPLAAQQQASASRCSAWSMMMTGTLGPLAMTEFAWTTYLEE